MVSNFRDQMKVKSGKNLPANLIQFKHASELLKQNKKTFELFIRSGVIPESLLSRGRLEYTKTQIKISKMQNKH